MASEKRRLLFGVLTIKALDILSMAHAKSNLLYHLIPLKSQ